ncbi:hypothetical protein [Clostridium saccharoperbutylacetonicum]
MINNLAKEKEVIIGNGKLDFGILFESKNGLKLSIILGDKQEEINEESIEVEYIENTGSELITEDLLDINSQLEEDNYKKFYDLLDKQMKNLWNEIFDRAMEVDIECKIYNKETKLLLNYEYIGAIELQSFLKSEYIDFIKKVDDDTYEIIISDEVFSIKFI